MTEKKVHPIEMDCHRHGFFHYISTHSKKKTVIEINIAQKFREDNNHRLTNSEYT